MSWLEDAYAITTLMLVTSSRIDVWVADPWSDRRRALTTKNQIVLAKEDSMGTKTLVVICLALLGSFGLSLPEEPKPASGTTGETENDPGFSGGGGGSGVRTPEESRSQAREIILEISYPGGNIPCDTIATLAGPPEDISQKGFFIWLSSPNVWSVLNTAQDFSISESMFRIAADRESSFVAGHLMPAGELACASSMNPDKNRQVFVIQAPVLEVSPPNAMSVVIGSTRIAPKAMPFVLRCSQSFLVVPARYETEEENALGSYPAAGGGGHESESRNSDNFQGGE